MSGSTCALLVAATASSSTPMLLADPAGAVTWANAAVSTLTGYPLEALVGHRHHEQLAGPDTDPATLARIAAHYAAAERFEAEFLAYRRSGETFWTRVLGEPVIGKAGTMDGWFCITTDLTEVRKAEEAAQRAQALLIEAQRISRIGSWEWRIEGDVVQWTPELFTIYGLDPADGVPPFAEHGALMEPESFARLGTAVHEAVTHGMPYHIPDLRLRRRDGTRRIGAARGDIICDRHGTIIGLRGTLQDVTEAFEAERVRVELEDRLQLALESSGDGIYDWDMLEQRVAYSTRWKQMLGYSEEEVGEGLEEWSSRVHPEDLPEALADVEAHLRGETSGIDFAVRMRRKDGTWHWIRSRGKVVARAANGAPARFVGTHVDIQAETDIADSLRRARDEAEAATLAKSAFLARMSHELRTPLNSIIGFAKIVMTQCRQALGPVHAHRLERVVANGTHLLKLINDILDLSKIEAQRMSVERSTVPLSPMLEDVRGMLEPLVKPGVALRFEPPSEPITLETDSAKLTQLLVNIVGNAIKFTSAGWVRVSTETLGDAVRISVRDTGPGIPADRLDAIFEAFEQADGTTQRVHGGTGLGLTISRSLATLLGGSLTVESVEGAGATFHLTLPLTMPATADAVAA